MQNMPGGGSLTAANYVYSVAKPDGLTLGAVTAPIYFAQLLGRKEVQFDWAKFTWIGTPEENDELLFIRSDQPYKTLLDLRKASEPPRCGASGVGSTGFYIPKLIEEIFGVKINVVTGYPGAADVDLAVEKNEVHCRGTTISAFFGREPGRTWAKNGFVRFLVQTGDKRNHRLPDTPTIWELMDQEKGMDAKKRLARVVLGPGAFGRPILATPGIPRGSCEAAARRLSQHAERSGISRRSKEAAMGDCTGQRRTAGGLGERGHQSAAGNHRADEKSDGRIVKAIGEEKISHIPRSRMLSRMIYKPAARDAEQITKRTFYGPSKIHRQSAARCARRQA